MTFGRLPKTQVHSGLAVLLSSDFSKKIRERGASYFSLGRVKIIRGSDIQLEASVSGSESYLVRFDWQEDTLYASCACPYFARGESCKHLWATVLAADAGSYLSVPASQPDVYVEFDTFEFEAGDFNDQDRDGLTATRYSPVQIPPPAPKPPAWQTQINGIARMHLARSSAHLNWPAARQILYIVDLSLNHRADGVVISTLTRDVKADGTWKPSASLLLRRDQISQLPSTEDREILSLLAGVVPYYDWSYSGTGERISGAFVVPHSLAARVVALAAQAGRLFVQIRARTDTLSPLTWDDGEPWRFGMDLRRRKNGGWEVAGRLRRGAERIELSEALLISTGGLVFTRSRAALLAEDTPLEFLFQLQQSGPIHAPEEDLDGLLGALLSLPALPFLELPEDIQIETHSPPPRPCLRICPIKDAGRASGKLQAHLSFDYEGRQINDHNQARGFYLAEARRFVERHAETEAAAVRLLSDLGAKHLKPTLRWTPMGGKSTSKPTGKSSAVLEPSSSRCRAVLTGLSCTAMWSTGKAEPNCRNFWRPCAGAKVWCSWTMEPTGFCRKSG